jgi:hypothetical protein
MQSNLGGNLLGMIGHVGLAPTEATADYVEDHPGLSDREGADELGVEQTVRVPGIPAFDDRIACFTGHDLYVAGGRHRFERLSARISLRCRAPDQQRRSRSPEQLTVLRVNQRSALKRLD